MSSKRPPSSRRPRRVAHARSLGWLAASGLFLTGCAPRSANLPETIRHPESPVTITVTADWDDADAAVRVALGRCGVAVEQRELVPRPGVDRGGPVPPQLLPADIVTYRYDLATIAGADGELTISRTRPASADRPIPITLRCRIGVFGDPAIESCVVESVAIRLRQLRGVGYAPVEWPD